MVYIVMAWIVVTYVVMAYVVMAYVVMAYVVMAYVIMACIVMAYIIMAYTVMACMVMTKGHLNIPYFFEGSCKLLDAEGEWCVDPQTNALRVWLDGCADPASVPLFFQYLGACRWRTPMACADLKAPKDASHRDLSDAPLRCRSSRRRFAVGMRRKGCPK